LSGHVFATKAYIDSQKKLVKQQYLPHMSPQYGELRPTNGWDLLAGLVHHSKFQWVSHISFVSAAASLTAVNQTLHDVWPSPGLVHYMYILWGFCPVTEFCHVQNSLCVQLLGSPLLAALLARHSSSGHHGKFAALYKEWNYGSFADGATCIQQGGHHVGHRPTF